MELLESQDPEKRKLIEATDRHKRELQKEIKSISERSESAMKNALIIGGALAITYLLVSQLGSSKKKSKKVKARKEEEDEVSEVEVLTDAAPSFLSQIGERIVSQATVVLLDIAKEKLAEYLSNRQSKDENS